MCVCVRLRVFVIMCGACVRVYLCWRVGEHLFVYVWCLCVCARVCLCVFVCVCFFFARVFACVRNYVWCLPACVFVLARG